jgi:hypothetical protein
VERFAPTSRGRDLDSTDRKYDAHVRLEAPPRERKRVIAVDVFDSKVKDSGKAHVESEYFPVSKAGAADAADFLLGYGFEVKIRLPRK